MKKVHTYIPQTSIIGRLLNHKEKTTILKSTQTGIMQHDLYSWQVLGDKFIKAEITNSSEFIDKTITKWLSEVNTEQRKIFIDNLFDILQSTKATTIDEMGNNWFLNAKTMVKSYKNLDGKSKEIMTKTLSELFRIARENINKKMIPNNIKAYTVSTDSEIYTEAKLEKENDDYKTTTTITYYIEKNLFYLTDHDYCKENSVYYNIDTQKFISTDTLEPSSNNDQLAIANCKKLLKNITDSLEISTDELKNYLKDMLKISIENK